MLDPRQSETRSGVFAFAEACTHLAACNNPPFHPRAVALLPPNEQPVIMNATKRKFNTLLQGLGAQRPTTPDNSVRDTSNSPLSSSTGNRALASESLLQKRRRLGQTASTSPLSTGQASMKRLPSGQLVQHPSSSATPAAQGGLLSKYCPSDRDQLLRRLVTFQELTDWTPKPERVSEVEWAKRGWVCQGKERVRCVLCHRELVVKVNRKEQDGQEIPVLVSSEIGASCRNFLMELYSLIRRGGIGRQICRADHHLTSG